jgi:hypothetical protein
MLITGEPSSELQQYLHRAGQLNVGMSITWNALFILPLFCQWRQKRNGLSGAGQRGGVSDDIDLFFEAIRSPAALA